ncbi:hypothetical protein a10_08786 [Streptomyces acidiscabies]|nr:hypothetical protein a10_08786 [Streptomyces acidiscabies]
MGADAQDRAYPAVRRRGRQVDGQLELPGQAADRGEAHARRVAEFREVDRRVPGDEPLRPLPFVPRHADARVVDGHAHPVVDVLQSDDDVGVRRGVPQRVVEQLGDDDGDRLDRVRDERGTGFEVVVDGDPVVPGEPGLPSGHRVDEVRLLPREPHPRPAHHGGHLRPPQRLLVLVVEPEQGLRQLRFVVLLLESAQGVLEPVERGLDLAGRAPHPGLRRRVDPAPLGGDLDAQRLQDLLQREPEGRADGERLERAGYLQVRMGDPACGGGYPRPGEVLDLGGERPHGTVELGAQRGDLGLLPSLPASGAQQAAAQNERGQRAGGETTDGQVR